MLSFFCFVSSHYNFLICNDCTPFHQPASHCQSVLCKFCRIFSFVFVAQFKSFWCVNHMHRSLTYRWNLENCTRLTFCNGLCLMPVSVILNLDDGLTCNPTVFWTSNVRVCYPKCVTSNQMRNGKDIFFNKSTNTNDKNKIKMLIVVNEKKNKKKIVHRMKEKKREIKMTTNFLFSCLPITEHISDTFSLYKCDSLLERPICLKISFWSDLNVIHLIYVEKWLESETWTNISNLKFQVKCAHFTCICAKIDALNTETKLIQALYVGFGLSSCLTRIIMNFYV